MRAKLSDGTILEGPFSSAMCIGYVTADPIEFEASDITTLRRMYEQNDPNLLALLRQLEMRFDANRIFPETNKWE